VEVVIDVETFLVQSMFMAFSAWTVGSCATPQ